MEIVLVSNGMPFGPDTLDHASLGGSETACLMVAKELKKLGNIVNVFTHLPPAGRGDCIPSGTTGDDGVRYVDYGAYASFIGNTEVDLLIVLRDPKAIATTNQARKRVLWMHDIATTRGMGEAFDQMSWVMDEIWAVSEWHRQQIHEVTGYPLKNIIAMRNGIVPVDVVKAPRLDNTLAYAARPERGLPNLITDKGIMANLPEYDLLLAMYGNFPNEMQDFYNWCGERIERLDNVDMPTELTQQDMRQRLADVTAYIYPTQFEETSCILARECIEQRTPMLTTKTGALPETLGDCGIYFEDWLRNVKKMYGGVAGYPNPGDDEWNGMFAEFTRWVLETEDGAAEISRALDCMDARTDLYWDGVAEKMMRHAWPEPVTLFSRAWSLVQDGDVVPAYRLLQEADVLDWASEILLAQIESFYPFMLEEDDPRYETLASYYKRFYAFKGDELDIDQHGLDNGRNAGRYQMICDEISKLPPGSKIMEYGCGEGHISVPLAQDFPQHHFYAFDQVQSNIDCLDKYPDGRPANLIGNVAETPEDVIAYVDGGLMGDERFEGWDLGICVEVLEHCVRPWEVIDGVERLVKEGGRVVITTPYGAWEPETFAKRADEFMWRNHIWNFDKASIRKMFSGKPNMILSAMSQGILVHDGRLVGNHFYAYDADHKPVAEFDPLEKADMHNARHTIGAAVIAMNNEDTILKMLNSIDRKAQVVQIALGPSQDNTLDIIKGWHERHPHTYLRVFSVPKIEAPKEYGGKAEPDEEYGFDDARNASAVDLERITDWTLWIDTDEYMSGYPCAFTRHNCMDGYLIAQHHFTVEPRGGEVQIDRPARLFKNTVGYEAKGRIHEHFEVPDGGPGHCYLLPNVDLGHTGYVNEDVRRDRFNRNFPFLNWEHEEGSDRKLHCFLWFRDIVHRMRYADSSGLGEQANVFAQEANDYYIEHREAMSHFGAGLATSLQYVAEVRRKIGIGTPLEVNFRFDDKSATVQGLFLHPQEVYDIMNDALEGEFKRRQSRHY